MTDDPKCPHGFPPDVKCGNCEQIEIAQRRHPEILMGDDCRPTADTIAELRRELNAAHERIDELESLLREARGCVVRGSQLDRRIEDALS